MAKYDIETVLRFRYTDNNCEGEFNDAVNISKAKVEKELETMGKLYCIGYSSSRNVAGTVFFPVHSVTVDYVISNNYSIEANSPKEAMEKVMEKVDKFGSVIKSRPEFSDIKLRRTFVH